MRQSLLRVCALLVVLGALILGSSERSAAETLDLRYVANEGFLVEGGGRRVLVDALFREGAPGYHAPDAETADQIERGLGRWAGVTLALASHHHRDHFDAEAVVRFLEHNPKATFVSTRQAVAKVLALQPDVASRARGVLPDPGDIETLEIDGVRLHVLHLHHGIFDPLLENLGFVVELDGQRFLHFGDTEAEHPDFEPYLDVLRGTDLALLPFWFLTSEWRVEMVRDEIRPRQIVVAHLPESSAPSGYFGRWGSHAEVVRLIRTHFPEARFPQRPGESLND